MLYHYLVPSYINESESRNKMMVSLLHWLCTFYAYFCLFLKQVCQERCTKMAPLSTVLMMYKERTYNRDSKAWAGVVCKYLHANYSCFSIPMMTFLIEVRNVYNNLAETCIIQFYDASKTATLPVTLSMSQARHLPRMYNWWTEVSCQFLITHSCYGDCNVIYVRQLVCPRPLLFRLLGFLLIHLASRILLAWSWFSVACLPCLLCDFCLSVCLSDICDAAIAKTTTTGDCEIGS